MSSMAFPMKDALTKVCPARQDGGVDRPCIGKDCMAWVWIRRDKDTAAEERVGFCAMVPDGY